MRGVARGAATPHDRRRRSGPENLACNGEKKTLEQRTSEANQRLAHGVTNIRSACDENQRSVRRISEEHVTNIRGACKDHQEHV